jgi:uncharacterized membrane protein (DUF485 family)
MDVSSAPRGEHADVDWEAAERSPEFQELVRRQRRFVVPATIFFLSWYLGFIVLAGYAESFMGESIYEGFTVGYALALTQFLMTWGLGWLYLRKADRDFDPLRERAASQALRDLGERQRTGRFDREPADASQPEVTR